MKDCKTCTHYAHTEIFENKVPFCKARTVILTHGKYWCADHETNK